MKVNPIADWSTQELTAYIAENNVLVNPLHARGFISIGCQPCTRAVQLELSGNGDCYRGRPRVWHSVVFVTDENGFRFHHLRKMERRPGFRSRT